MNRRQITITTIGVLIISAICVYCLIEYGRIDKSYPKGTYKFQQTTKTQKIRTLFFTLGLYTIFVAAATGTLIYVARSKDNELIDEKQEQKEETIEEVDNFVKTIHTSDDIEMEMRRLDNLKAKRIISEEEYNNMVNEIFRKV